eukprot:10739291-Alexandrium_andersonii.AAC.1
MFDRAVKSLEAGDATLVRTLAAGGIWIAQSLCRIGKVDTERCQRCGAQCESLQHLLWECPSLDSERDAAFPGWKK